MNTDQIINRNLTGRRLQRALEAEIMTQAKAQVATQPARKGQTMECRVAAQVREMLRDDPSIYSEYMASRPVASGGTRELQALMQEAG